MGLGITRFEGTGNDRAACCITLQPGSQLDSFKSAFYVENGPYFRTFNSFHAVFLSRPDEYQEFRKSETGGHMPPPDPPAGLPRAMIVEIATPPVPPTCS